MPSIEFENLPDGIFHILHVLSRYLAQILFQPLLGDGANLVDDSNHFATGTMDWYEDRGTRLG